MVHFGDKLRKLRKDSGLSQSQLSKRLTEWGYKIGQTHLSKLEQAELPPRGIVIEKLSEFFDVDPMYFYGSDEPAQFFLLLDSYYIYPPGQRVHPTDRNGFFEVSNGSGKVIIESSQVAAVRIIIPEEGSACIEIDGISYPLIDLIEIAKQIDDNK